MRLTARRAPATRTTPDRDPSRAKAWHLSPDERIGPPLAGARGKYWRRGAAVIVLALAGWWTMGQEPGAWREWASTIARTLTPARPAPPPDETAAVQPTSAGTTTPGGGMETPLRPPETVPTPAPPPSEAVTVRELNNPAAAQAPAKGAPAPAASAPAPGEAYRAIDPPPADPRQQRAVAIGLHPELSLAVLARLTPADLDNAATAIRTALAETPDDGTLVWPRQRRPEQALFRVHFVAGAAAGCRRYVVTVVKDGWTATALPMERCAPARR